ncbi:unnamed protein product [Caenorhabditis angaria]|uniref:GTF3C1 extended winged-helix domain-containing protein n=1 Tax=Caenorhabditis angaria TaxID=860376 RepID=A0A9P1IRN3_9PELO|nr:unnamed protein product [Caenorhabditis angaria]
MDDIQPGTSTFAVLQNIRNITEPPPTTPTFTDNNIDYEDDGEEDVAQISLDISLDPVEKVEEAPVVIDAKGKKPPKPPKRPVEKFSDIHFQNTSLNMYVPFNPTHWTSQINYRMPQDIVISAIRNNGTEGLPRTEIGYSLGYDANLKTGSRRVSQHIITANTEQSDHIGQYQKMDGKIRTIRYYWKENEQPEKFGKILRDFEFLTGAPCPYKIGEVVKFPETNLNTLRISDVSLQRLYRILQIAETHRVIVTSNKLIRMISEEEMSEGYKYMIDKKSLTKCLLALKRKQLIQTWETTVTSDLVDHQVTIVAHRDIQNVSDDEVKNAIQTIVDEYHREGRVFPHGQQRILKNKIEKTAEKSSEVSISNIDENLEIPRTILDRYDFFRLQAIRNSYSGKAKNKKEASSANDSIDLGDEEEPEAECDEENIHEFTLVYNNLAPANGKKQFNKNYHVGTSGFGYQPKAIRLYTLHQMIFHLVYQQTQGNRTQTLFDLFPPTKPFESWPSLDEENAPTYTDNQQFRFVPPQPVFAGSKQGWFMLQDLLVAMPLSVLAICAFLPKKIEKTFLFHYLNHPDRRHLCVGHLPQEQREAILRDKKVLKQLQHCLLLLGALGIVRIGPNPCVRRFPSCGSEMYWVSKYAELYDTSTSDKGYATISRDYRDFQKYEYEFLTLHDVTLYWHHLRAIVLSTPLSFRLEDHSEQSRHKVYSAGYFDKKLIERPHESEEKRIYPIGPRDGVAGFDSALFMHVKKNWDMITNPSSVCSWFISQFRKDSEELKTLVEERVEHLQKDWNSFMKSLMPTDLDLTKSKMKTVTSMAEFTLKQVRKRGAGSDGNNGNSRKLANHKKRKMDSIDCISNANRVFIRCRFTPKERDQLIMIRAVGFFLNPVYRFWLDPTVLRDLMHEFVPESRTKTVQSLMACGVRELVRPNRLAYLQRIVRNLSTFPEMRELRWQLCTSPVSPIQTKTEFFKDAYRLAMKLLFADNNRIPHPMVSDNSFNDFLDSSNVLIKKETVVNNPLPYRSQTPKTPSHIQHCIASNLLISILIHSTPGDFAETVLSQISPSVLQKVLQSLRSDGLVSRVRQGESDVVSKNQAALSYYFRHFFSHRYHPDLVDSSGVLLEEINTPNENSDEMIELAGDSPSVLVAASCAFFDDNYKLEMSVDEDIMDVFENTENDQTTKKIRYLESANLHFEKIHVYLDKNSGEDEEEDEEIPKIVENLMILLDRSIPIDEPVCFADWIENCEEPAKSRNILVYNIIASKAQTGAALQDLVESIDFSTDYLLETMSDLYEGRQIIECGVDEKRWTTIEFEHIWKITVLDKKWTPRPWIMPMGGVCLATVRWMAESVLLTIVSKLGIQLSDLHFQFEFAIQPVVLRELIDILETLKCVEVVVKEFVSHKMKSPFEESTEKVSIVYVVPTPNALEIFSRIFHGVPLLPTMSSAKTTDDHKK